MNEPNLSEIIAQQTARIEKLEAALRSLEHSFGVSMEVDGQCFECEAKKLLPEDPIEHELHCVVTGVRALLADKRDLEARAALEGP